MTPGSSNGTVSMGMGNIVEIEDEMLQFNDLICVI